VIFVKIFAISTTFYPNEKVILENLKNISSQIEIYILVDNSETYSFEHLTQSDKIEIIYNTNNGVSGGLNIGIKRAIELNADYVILFDQDSICEKGMIEKLLQTPNIHSQAVIAAPNILDHRSKESIHKKFFSRGLAIDDRFIEVNRTQTSGLLIPTAIFKSVGLFNEHYFLNFVDTEWCMRASSAGYKIIIDTKSCLFHDFGEGEKAVFFYKFSYGKPFRDYYTARDSLYLLGVKENSYAFRFRLFLFFSAAFFQIFFLDEKALRMNYFFRGISHFFKGIKGKGI
jgi:rhamnosyltransferase